MHHFFGTPNDNLLNQHLRADRRKTGILLSSFLKRTQTKIPLSHPLRGAACTPADQGLQNFWRCPAGTVYAQALVQGREISLPCHHLHKVFEALYAENSESFIHCLLTLSVNRQASLVKFIPYRLFSRMLQTVSAAAGNSNKSLETQGNYGFGGASGAVVVALFFARAL